MTNGGPWFLVRLLYKPPSGSSNAYLVDTRLILAESGDEAYQKAVAISLDPKEYPIKTLGISSLIRVFDDDITDLTELFWREEEVVKNEFGQKAVYTHSPDSIFVNSPSGWFLGSLGLTEHVSDASGVGASVFWEQSYLLREESAAEAFGSLLTCGRLIEEHGDHLVDGFPATWKFEGISQLRPSKSAPSDGALLETTEVVIDGDIFRWVPDREQLEVFTK